MLRGAIAAAVTPLRDAGEALDEDAFGPYVDFLAASGLAGLLALGTTGEGFLLPVEQRMQPAQCTSKRRRAASRSPFTAARSRRGRLSSSPRTRPRAARTR